MAEADTSTERTEAWAAARLQALWVGHFSDVAKGFPITTVFARRALHRFGSITARNGRTIITLNRLFADPAVPEYVVDGTIAHELAHYAHGFGSGLPRLYRDPHRGGVVENEL
ncbi:MAG TPA: hypothetical protein VGS41_01385, partial [Chthonomonadales bacterium]|nr:hypothetical protein [Chthonomonadales bacterium]